MAHNERPISESYWVEEGVFLAGEYPGRFDMEQTRKRLDALLAAGFNTFIDLTGPDEGIPYLKTLEEQSLVYGMDLDYQRFPIGDFGLPTPELMRAILEKIETSLESGRKVYLHCWAGIGRTGTVVGCYLVGRGFSGEQALHQLAARWQGVPKSHIHPHSPETPEQAAFIRDWKNPRSAP